MTQKPTYEELEERVQQLEQYEVYHRLSANNSTGMKSKLDRSIFLNKQLYGTLFEKNISMILVIDPKTARIINANPSACSYYGYSKKRLTSMKISDINTLSKDDIYKEMRKAESEHKKHFHFRHRLSNGSIRDVEVFTNPISVDGKSLICTIIHDISERKKHEKEKEKLIDELQSALSEIKTLKGIIPICASCKNIRDNKGSWNQIESYIKKHSEAEFTHGICPECIEKLHGHEEWYIQAKTRRENKKS